MQSSLAGNPRPWCEKGAGICRGAKAAGERFDHTATAIGNEVRIYY